MHDENMAQRHRHGAAWNRRATDARDWGRTAGILFTAVLIVLGWSVAIEWLLR